MPRLKSLVGKMTGHPHLTDLPGLSYAVFPARLGQAQHGPTLVDGVQGTAQLEGHVLVARVLYMLPQVVILILRPAPILGRL